MDNSQTALNEQATEAEATTPVAETEALKTEVEGKAEETPTGETETETETEVEEGGRKTANARIRELNAKAKAAEAKAQSLAERVAELTGSFEPGAQAQSYEPQAEPGAEISPEQYRSDVARQADQIVQLRMKQKEVLDRVNDESREAIKTYPQLDPNSGEFNADLSESISKATLAIVSRNPTASVKKFVESLMKPYLRSVTREVGEASEKMAKQVSETALRPTSVREREKTASEMSIEELKTKLGVVY